MTDKRQQGCRNTAIKLLSLRDHSVKELRQKLSARKFDSSEIDDVLESLKQENFLSDDRFAECYVRSKMNKGIGPIRLRHELRERGVDDLLIENNITNHDWRSLAAEVRRKRYGDALPEAYEVKVKQMRFLQSRGFSSEQINSVMKSNEWE